MSFRLKITIGPCIEAHLSGFVDIVDTVPFFEKALLLFPAFKHLVVFVIPATMVPVFYTNPRLRMFVEKVQNDSQLNIIISDDFMKDCSADEIYRQLRFPELEEANCTQKYTIFHLNSKRVALFADLKDQLVLKLECENCEEECRVGFEVDCFVMPSGEDMTKTIELAAELNLQNWVLDINAFSQSDLKNLAFLSCIIHSVSSKELQCLQKFSVLDSCINEVKREDADRIIDIAFSMFRAVTYPPLRDVNRHKLSIDWHLNDPRKISGYNYELYRVDVVPGDRSGRKNSGARRLLLAILGDKRIFIGFTSTHDFEVDTIRERLSEIV